MSDLSTATFTLGDSASAIGAYLAQMAAGDPAARAALIGELKNAKYFRAYYKDVEGADFTEIDRLINQAERATAIVRAESGGLRIGAVRIPWIGVIGGGVVIGAAVYAAYKMRRRRRRYA